MYTSPQIKRGVDEKSFFSLPWVSHSHAKVPQCCRVSPLSGEEGAKGGR